MHRSWLFVPGDSERKLAKAPASGADALILDLEDSVAPERKADARQTVRAFLKAQRGQDGPALFVRINPFGGDAATDDLESVMDGAPAGIVLPKAGSAQDVMALGGALSALEDRLGLTAGSTRIVPIATETPAAVFQLQSYAARVPRLAGLSWGAEDLSAAVGATATREDDGQWRAPYRLVRSLCLFAAHAAGVAAVDTVHANFRDADALARDAARARQDGFTGKLAIHPAQVEPINAAFTPSEREIEDARRIVAAFDAAPGAGVVALDGRMLDRPHLVGATRTLALAERLKN